MSDNISLSAFIRPEWLLMQASKEREEMPLWEGCRQYKLRGLGIHLDEKITDTIVHYDEMGSLACARNKYMSDEELERQKNSSFIRVPNCGHINLKEFMQSCRDEMETMWTEKNIEGAGDAYGTLYACHLHFTEDTQELEWCIELIRDTRSPHYLVRLGRLFGRNVEKHATLVTDEMLAAITLRDVIAETVNNVVCRHYPDLLKEQQNSLITVP